MLRILDGSHWNGRPSTSQLRAAKPDIILWKATQGTWYVDTSYATMIKRIRSVCLAGAYMFGEPGKGSAKAQVEFFLDHAKLRNGEIAMHDLEQSALGQSGTGQFNREVGDLLRKLHPGVRWNYLGGYASNGSGRNAADHYDRWMYPRYRTLIKVTSWPEWPPYAYPSGGGTTGWKIPHVWQFAPAMKWAAGLYGDASISPHTVTELTNGAAAPQEDEMNLTDKVTLPSWIPKLAPGNEGIQDGQIQVNTALGSTYGHAYAAHINTEKILAAVSQLTDPAAFAAEVVKALNPGAIADAVLAKLGPEQAKVVADELSKRLAS